MLAGPVWLMLMRNYYFIRETCEGKNIGGPFITLEEVAKGFRSAVRKNPEAKHLCAVRLVLEGAGRTSDKLMFARLNENEVDYVSEVYNDLGPVKKAVKKTVKKTVKKAVKKNR